MGLDICVHDIGVISISEALSKLVAINMVVTERPVIVDAPLLWAYATTDGRLSVCYSVSSSTLREIEKIAAEYGLQVQLPDYDVKFYGASVTRLRKQLEMMLALEDMKPYREILSGMWQVFRIAEQLGKPVKAH